MHLGFIGVLWSPPTVHRSILGTGILLFKITSSFVVTEHWGENISFNSALIKYNLFIHLCDKRCLIKRIINDTSVSSQACRTSSFPSGLEGKSPANIRSDMRISVITYLLSQWRLAVFMLSLFSFTFDCNGRTRGNEHTLAYIFNQYRCLTVM